MPAHFQPLCAPTAFKPHISVGCGSSGGCAHSQPEGAPPTPCCRRGRPGGWSEALCVLRGAPGQANIVAEVRISFSHGFCASCRCLGPHKGDPAPRPGANSPPTAAGTMLVLRRAPSKVVFRVLIPHLETKISVRLFVRVRRPRSTQSPMGAKERAHAGVVHAQPPPQGCDLSGKRREGGILHPPGPVHTVSLL